MPGEFDPEEFAHRYPKFRPLWDNYLKTKAVYDKWDSPVTFRAPGQGYASSLAVPPTSEFITAKKKLENAKQKVMEFCMKNGLANPPF